MALVSSVVEAAQEETAPLVGLAEAQLLYPVVVSGSRPRGTTFNLKHRSVASEAPKEATLQYALMLTRLIV